MYSFNQTSQFYTLNKELQEEILTKLNNTSPWNLAKEYAQETGMDKTALYMFLKKKLPKNGKTVFRKKKNGQIYAVEEKELTEEELQFIEKLRKGEASLEETSRLVAARVFEQMLKFPDKFQYLDFFRTELLKMKKEESQLKENWAKQLINRMFMGKLPPSKCPSCGFDLTGEIVIEGEIVHGNELTEAK
jgi:hypothetical protein